MDGPIEFCGPLASALENMNRRSAFAIFGLSALGVVPTFAQMSQDFKREFEEAEQRIVRLQPTAFPQLPVNVVRELQRRGCTIPQEASTKSAQNVIKGQFAKTGQTDWAVLCSVKFVSSILVFWNGSEKSPAVIAQREDRTFLQTISADEIGFSRAIAPVGKDFIMRHFEAYGGPKPPPIVHQGIDDAFIGKASVTWYFYGGKWLTLQGAD
jgi:hypothetical protein